MATYIKKADRSATLSFCPSGPFLAAGSVAGAIDLSFSSASTLEIFRLDFASTDADLKLAGGAVQAPERFCRVCWGPPGLDSKTYPYGLLAGGLADGSVCVWNPARIIGHKAEAAPASPAAGRGQLLARLQKHSGAVKGLEFNGFSPNLLASGGADGDLCIWDVGNPLQPSLYPAMKSGAGGPQPEITHLAWNRKVQHILGTCTAAGAVVVWDLKKQKPVISFKDPSGRKRCSALQWNPEVATQLVVASDDDMAPSLQLWDLRNSVSPVREFHGHAKGVLGLSWCPQDPSFLLSSGKDNRTICWDVNAGEVYCELPPAANWNFDVQWAPGPLAGIFATATFEGHVGVTSLSACTASADSDGFSVGQGASSLAKTKAPAWLSRPAGATLGFGGRLAQFTNSRRQLATGESVATGSVIISQVTTEPQLVQRSEAFEAAIRGGDREALAAFCADMEQRLAGSEEAETWAFLQTHFAADGRKHLLERLGFGELLPADAAAEAPAADGDAQAQALDAAAGAAGLADGVQQLGLGQNQAAAEALLAGGDDGADFFSQSPVNDQAFFDQLAGTPPRASALSPSARRSTPTSPQPPAEPAVIDGPPGEREGEVQRLLFVGNYQGAVDACLEAKRHADALVIASAVGGDAFDRARRAYMLAHPRPFMRLLHAVLGGEWTAFISARHPSAWRETLAAILTSAPYDQFEPLLAALAARLAHAGMAHAATLCHVCAGDVDAAVRQWTLAAAKQGAPPSVQALEDLMEKAVVLGIGVNRQSSSDALSDLIVRYAELLAANGRLGTALDYLGMLPGEPTTAVAVLKERLYSAAAASGQLPPGVAPPPFPFAGEEVVAASYQQPTAAPAAYGAQGGYGGAAAATSYQQAAPQQPAGGYQSYGGGYGGGAPSAGQTNGYGSAPPSSGYGSAPSSSGYGAAAAAPAAPQQQAQQQYATYGGGYGGAASYQPASGYGGPSPASTPTAAAMPQPAYQPAPAAVYQPTASAAQVYQPAAAPAAQYQAAPAAQYQAAPAAVPPQVYQPAASPGGGSMQYQAGPPVGGPAQQVYQPSGRAPSAAAPPSHAPSAFVPQQGPSGAAAPAPPSARSGPTPTPITAPPPPPPGPPANISLQTADTSAVPPQLQPVIASLSNLYRACEAAAGGHPGKRREVEDSSRKLGALFWKLNKGEVSQSVAGKLLQLCQALDGGDFVTATHLQVSLTTSDWDECSAWLTALKRLIKARQMMG